MGEVKKTAWAQAITNDDFICVETYSGYRSSIADPKGTQHLLSVDASDSELGSALLDALAFSRFVTPEEDLSLFDYRLVMERYKEWLSKLIVTYAYKSKRALLKEMRNCEIERCEGFMEFIPRCHEALETWTSAGISKNDHVIIPSDSPPAEVGAALRLALSRCT